MLFTELSRRSPRSDKTITIFGGLQSLNEDLCRKVHRVNWSKAILLSLSGKKEKNPKKRDDLRCRLCDGATRHLHKGVILERTVDYYECFTCKYVQTERPYWLEEAYRSAINLSDTGIIVRNINNANIVLSTLLLTGDLHGSVVDYAGGYGILTRILRDYGVNAYWIDRLCENQLARGFEYVNEEVCLLTAFEAFEHFESPFAEFKEMLRIAPNILISTGIIADPAPAQDDWWYYGSGHGQHIGFFRVETLNYMAERMGKYLVTDGRSYHAFLDRPKNDTIWNWLIKFNRSISLVMKTQLKSKTWEDHVSLSGLKK